MSAIAILLLYYYDYSTITARVQPRGDHHQGGLCAGMVYFDLLFQCNSLPVSSVYLYDLYKTTITFSCSDYSFNTPLEVAILER